VGLLQGSPCHLYFDLEFEKKKNTNKKEDDMVDILLSVVFDLLLEKYSIQGNEDWVIELDSSTSG
jgi:DNA-directed primase/polymerase protein